MKLPTSSYSAILGHWARRRRLGVCFDSLLRCYLPAPAFFMIFLVDSYVRVRFVDV